MAHNNDVQLGIKVRCLQQQSNLSCMQAENVASLLADHTDNKPNLREADRTLAKESGVEKVVLHGCVHCHQHVYGTKDKRANCPLCGGSRYKIDSTRTPNEVVYYFPLRKRLEALLRLPNFLYLLQVYIKTNAVTGFVRAMVIISMFMTCFMFTV